MLQQLYHFVDSSNLWLWQEMITKYDVKVHMEVNTSCAMQPYRRKRIHKKLNLPHRKWYKCKRVKTINKNVAGDELKFEDFKKKNFP